MIDGSHVEFPLPRISFMNRRRVKNSGTHMRCRKGREKRERDNRHLPSNWQMSGSLSRATFQPRLREPFAVRHPRSKPYNLGVSIN
jgi:hypothetical protein